LSILFSDERKEEGQDYSKAKNAMLLNGFIIMSYLTLSQQLFYILASIFLNNK
jgi:hypothetical protein